MVFDTLDLTPKKEFDTLLNIGFFRLFFANLQKVEIIVHKRDSEPKPNLFAGQQLEWARGNHGLC